MSIGKLTVSSGQKENAKGSSVGTPVDTSQFEFPTCMGPGNSERPDCHKHKCEHCGAVWIHPDWYRSLSDRLWLKAHKCPACGKTGDETKKVYDGEELPTHSHYPPVPKPEFLEGNDEA